MRITSKRCRVCLHPAREAIEETLVVGHTLATALALFGDCTLYALGEHRRRHLSPELVDLLERARDDARRDWERARAAAELERLRKRAEAWTPERIQWLAAEDARLGKRLDALREQLNSRVT